MGGGLGGQMGPPRARSSVDGRSSGQPGLQGSQGGLQRAGSGPGPTLGGGPGSHMRGGVGSGSFGSGSFGGGGIPRVGGGPQGQAPQGGADLLAMINKQGGQQPRGPGGGGVAPPRSGTRRAG